MALEAKDVAVGYGDETVVRDANFSLEAGKVMAVLGPNGVGKTTLFKAILGYLPLDDGTIEIDSEDIRGMSRPAIARAIAYVPQKRVVSFSYTIEEIVLMGRAPHLKLLQQPGPEDRAIAREALDEMGIAHLAKKAANEVSGGELQLAAIARALAQRPRYLVMDEPTSALDFGNQARVLERVLDLAASGIGVLMTTHDPAQAFALDADVVLMQRGGRTQFGPVRQVLTEQTLEQAYGVPVAVEAIQRHGQTVECCVALVRRRH